MLKREDYIKRISYTLAQLRTEISLRGYINLYDGHIIAEDFMASLLNIVFSYQLQNLNYLHRNQPGIDLGDTASGIAFQVTAEKSKTKIQKTIDKFINKKLYTKYPQLYFFILQERYKPRSNFDTRGYFTFNNKENILDFSDLIKKINALETEELKKIVEFFDREISNLVKLDYSKTQGAALALRIAIHGKTHPAARPGWVKLRIAVSISSTNSVSSENGAFKLTVARPIIFSRSTQIVFRAANFEMSTGLPIKGYADIPHAQSMMMRWGASLGTVIFPGDWHNFYDNPISVDIPDLSHLSNSTYLLQAELFTVNSQTKKMLYSIQQNPDGDFDIYEVEIDAASYDSVAASFWATYHAAIKMFSS